MLAAKLSVLIVLIALASLSQLAQHPVVGQYTLPDRNKTVQFIDNLIDSYNLLVDEFDKPRQDFAVIKAYFPLFHEAGNSFKVIVVQIEPYTPEWLSLIFIPFRADQPNVIMDYKDTFSSFFPSIVAIQGEYYSQENLPFTYNDTAIHLDFVLSVYSPRISGDYITNSNAEAQDLYQQDQNKVPTVSQTQTIMHTINQTRITTIETPNPWEYVINDILPNPLLAVGLAVVALYVVFIVLIPAIWGSDEELYNRIKKKLAERNKKKKNNQN